MTDLVEHQIQRLSTVADLINNDHDEVIVTSDHIHRMTLYIRTTDEEKKHMVQEWTRTSDNIMYNVWLLYRVILQTESRYHRTYNSSLLSDIKDYRMLYGIVLETINQDMAINCNGGYLWCDVFDRLRRFKDPKETGTTES